MLKKTVIGILGGVGSGKSTVAAAFSDLGCRVIDADAIAHEVLNEPAIVDTLTQRWGGDILDSPGRADRKKVAVKVFDAPEELEFLNGLIHPQVLERCQAEIQACRANQNVRGIVLDMPLLLEVGWEKKCDFLVFVECSEVKKAERVAKNGKFDIEQMRKRENFQISLDKKKQKAHYIVHNNSDKSDMAEQVARIFSNILETG